MSVVAWFRHRDKATGSGESLRDKTQRGGAWLGSGSVVEQASRFVRNMLLTRLLAPNAFGAMAIVLSLSSLITSLSDVGLAPAVIQNPRGGEDDYLNTAWWLGMFRALMIYAVIFPAAPWVASFYGNPELNMLLRVTLLGVVLEAAISPRAKLAQRQMQFARVTIINNGGAICGVALTLILSFTMRSVWALAIGYCSENAFRCLFSYIFCPGLPYLKWNRDAVRELMHFSKGMFGLSFLNLIFSRTDIFVLGKLYPPEVLGLYTMAIALVQTPCGFLINTMVQTLLPAFSHLQNDMQRTNRVLAEATASMVVVGLPAIVAIAFSGSSLLAVAYGSRYIAGSSALIVAAAVALLNALNALLTTQFYGVGKPGLHRMAVAASAVVMLIAIYPACKYLGPVGGQWAALIAVAVSYGIQIVRTQTLTGMKLRHYAKGIAPAVLAAGATLLAGSAVHFSGIAKGPLLNMLSSAVICLLVYACCIPVFRQLRESRT